MANYNIKPRWKKGESGNPKGRPPKGECYTDLLRQALTKKEFVEKVRELFLKGDPTIIKHVWDRFEGRVPDKHEITGGDDEPLNINVNIKRIGNKS